MAKRWNFDKYIKGLKAKKRTLPREIGIMAKNQFVYSFRMQRFNDSGSMAWQPRKNNYDPGRAILIGKGTAHLRNSIRVKSATFKKIAVGSYGLAYASVHNRGLGHMPKRQFIGNSTTLTTKIRKKVSREIKDVFK